MTVFAVGGTANGFVGVYDGMGDAGEVTEAVFVSPATDGGSPSVGSPVSILGGTAQALHGSSDGTGAGFSMLYPGSSSLSFGYGKDGLAGGFHVTPIMNAPSNDPTNIAAFNKRFGVFHYSNPETRTYGAASGCPGSP